MRAWTPFIVGLLVGLGGGLLLGTRLQGSRQAAVLQEALQAAEGLTGTSRVGGEGHEPLADPRSGSLEIGMQDLQQALGDTQRDVSALLDELRARPLGAGPASRTPVVTKNDTSAPEVTLPMVYEELRGLRFLVDPDAGTDDVSTRVLEAMRDPNHGIDWGAWQPILDLWEHDRAEARSKVKLMTEEQVLQRFGPPSDVWSNTQGITWQYARGPKGSGADGKGHELEILLRIPNGYVTQLVVR